MSLFFIIFGRFFYDCNFIIYVHAEERICSSVRSSQNWFCPQNEKKNKPLKWGKNPTTVHWSWKCLNCILMSISPVQTEYLPASSSSQGRKTSVRFHRNPCPCRNHSVAVWVLLTCSEARLCKKSFITAWVERKDSHLVPAISLQVLGRKRNRKMKWKYI